MCKRKDDTKGQPATVAREWSQAGWLDAENVVHVQNGTEINHGICRLGRLTLKVSLRFTTVYVCIFMCVLIGHGTRTGVRAREKT